MFISLGRPMLTGGRMFSLALLTLAIGASSAVAQPSLSLTMAESGNFQIFNPQGIGTGCTQYSPQFSNFTGTIPGSCQSLILLFIENIGTAPTLGTVTLNDTIVSYMPKAVSILPAPYSTPLSLSGQPVINWACSVNPGSNQFTCTTNDALLPGKIAAIAVRVLVEDFAQYGMNNLAKVSVFGSPSASAFDSEIQWSPTSAVFPPPFISPFATSFVTVHSIPEGLTVLVDGVRILTPHNYTWGVGDQHTITADGPSIGIVFSGLNSPAQPTEPGTGGSKSPPPNPIIASPLNYIVTGAWFEQLTVLYSKP